MSSSATQGLLLRSRTGVEWRFDPGALCLELLATGGPGIYRRFEVLHGPADVVTWAEQSRLTPTPRLAVTDDEVGDVRRVRDALFRVTTARAADEEPRSRDLETINKAAACPPLVPAIGPGGQRRWVGTGSGTQLLATVARDAVDLLTGPMSHRIRTCAGSNCALVYVDTSRPGRRRWCSMERCGNRHKVRTHRARLAEE
jgi:predicted RNA-binding Zn ribbon-like protein